MFNEGNYEAQAGSGALTVRVASSRHPSAPRANVPYCTWSQIVQYLDASGTEIVTAHQYLQPDGTLGASGRPDPKRILKDGTL